MFYIFFTVRKLSYSYSYSYSMLSLQSYDVQYYSSTKCTFLIFSVVRSSVYCILHNDYPRSYTIYQCALYSVQLTLHRSISKNKWLLYNSLNNTIQRTLRDQQRSPHFHDPLEPIFMSIGLSTGDLGVHCKMYNGHMSSSTMYQI